eukprot:262416-Rhodomonas_salina.3
MTWSEFAGRRLSAMTEPGSTTHCLSTSRAMPLRALLSQYQPRYAPTCTYAPRLIAPYALGQYRTPLSRRVGRHSTVPVSPGSCAVAALCSVCRAAISKRAFSRGCSRSARSQTPPGRETHVISQYRTWRRQYRTRRLARA